MLSDTLRYLRKSRGLTQVQLADALNVSQSTVASWENGSRRPDLDILPQIAKFYGVSADILLDGEMPSDDDPWQVRERLRRDPDFRELFSTAVKASPDHIRAVTATLKALEPPEGEAE
jgi:transcriptional regulator with XRE-family HTH domain